MGLGLARVVAARAMAVAALFFALGPAWAQDAGNVDCFEKIKKSIAPTFDPRGGLTAGVDNFNPAENSVVLVELKFTAIDTPPAVKVLYAAGNPKLPRVVEEAVLNYRITCMPQGHNAYTATQRFVLRGIESDWPRLKENLGLVELLRLARDARARPVRFDFTTMGCPFQVEFGPYRPFTTNAVEQVGTPSPARQEFIGWLRELTLDFPPKFMRTAMGEKSIVTVPCTVLDLS